MVVSEEQPFVLRLKMAILNLPTVFWGSSVSELFSGLNSKLLVAKVSELTAKK